MVRDDLTETKVKDYNILHDQFIEISGKIPGGQKLA